MKSKLSLILPCMVIIGIVVMLVATFFPGLVTAQSNREIPMKYATALSAETALVRGGGVLYIVTGYAASSSATYSIHDVDVSDNGEGNHTWIRECYSNTTMAEGGETTQYDSFDTLDFRPDGIPFSKGLAVITTAASVAVAYK